MDEETKPGQKKATSKIKRKVTRRQKAILEGDGGLQTSTPHQFSGTPQYTLPELWANIIASHMQSFALSHKEEVFVTQFLASGNATEAARQAGYKDAKTSGRDLMKRESIRTAVGAAGRAMMTRNYANAEQINGALAAIGLADHVAIKRALVGEEGDPKDFENVVERLRRLSPREMAPIKSININAKQGTISVAFEPKTDALKALSQNLGLTRGREDRDSVTLIIEEVVEEKEENPEEKPGKLLRLSDNLVVDFSENGDDESPKYQTP